ncbi:MAG: DUF3131 domain-containing protein [Oscillospiraceae bacterium]|nr:DUF3131 domain-containing protein [Oscillospiraceae bacterium]
MSTSTVPREALLEGAALQNHLRAVAAECYRTGARRTGARRLRGIGSAARRLEISLNVLRARRDVEQLTPAARWLVDNARMLEETCMTLREDLRGCPALPAHGGAPRVQRLAQEWIAHTNAQADGDALARAAAYWQEAEPLTEGELCTLPLAMRHALLLLVADLAAESAECERARTHAESTLSINAGGQLDAYWEHLLFLLQSREDADALSRLDHRLAEMGLAAGQLVEREHERQTRACLWTGNAIASLRALSAMDWREQLETLSTIDHALRQDPAGLYARMDFRSRALYRRRAAKLAERFRLPESVVARKALACAERGAAETIPELNNHVGYYLLDGGQPLLWADLGKTPLPLKISRALGKRAALLYVLMIFIGSTATGVLLFLLGVRHWLVAPAMLVAGEGFRQLSGLFIHRLSPPRLMPRIAPDQLAARRILVVVPTLLTGRAQALDMVRHLSILRLANPESKLSYMLLGDFKDGPAETEPDDAAITDAALTATKALSEVWNGGFYYLHRGRLWNEKQGRFMGKERKRGALRALNRLILEGVCEEPIAAASCKPEELKGQFDLVITLDADTQLPPGTALELAGMLEHPLSAPLVVGGKRRGCAVIQPRMETSAATVHSRIARIWGGDGGFDPYITAFSDIYQNLCGEGSFAGKGIYAVKEFEAAVAGKIADNTVLSHDLLEGGLVGSSLAVDVALYDSQPGSLSAWMKRLHRWTRGDWQLLPWLIPWVKGEGGWMKNPLTMLNQFKIYDNLRRSLVPMASTLLIVFGTWLRLPAAFLAGLLLPHARALLPVSRKSLLAAASHLAMQPYEAMTLLDAALRTVYRVLFSRKHLLEWLPSAEAERQRVNRGAARFWPNYLAGALLVAAAIVRGGGWLLALPLGVLWLIAPLTARWLDAKENTEAALTGSERELLLDIARRTFRFFERTVGEATCGLPPDNLQIDPPRGIAPRTSPTNIGMYLLATVSACELGLIDADGMARRIARAADAMEQMERWQGHFYNWYDIKTLAPLPGRYVSAVDSGNLCGCLLLVSQALRSHLSEVDKNLLTLPARLDALAAAMDFSPLYDGKCDLFYIGLNAETGTPDGAHYDLLASEARLLSYIAVMRREVPVKHWHRLGRSMTRTAGRGAALLSWSGTLFEYLLPTLFLHSPKGTLLGDTCLYAARTQIAAFGEGPWGVSESGYYAFDPSLSYQYRAFGMATLALRTAETERVIAPYASALALSVAPREALSNLKAMAEMGWLGELGFYEAADYNPKRLPRRTEYRLVQSHMAHHQGMVLASICNELTGGKLTSYFHSLPQVRAYALLLEERRPSRAMLRSAGKIRRLDFYMRPDAPPLRRPNPLAFPPEAQVLYGGGTTLVSDARGGGYLSHNGVLLTRRRLDPLYEGGFQVYLRHNGQVLRLNAQGETVFDRHKAISTLKADGLEAELSAFVSPLDGAAVHQVRLHASPDAAVELEVASFFEVCLSSQAADESHPAFRNLSVETARLNERAAMARRRPQKPGETNPLLLHCLGGEIEGAVLLETSRAAFLGRGERLGAPAALEQAMPDHDGAMGAVIDPCMSLRARVRVPAGDTITLWFATAAAQSEEALHSLAAQYTSREHVARAMELAITQDEVTAQYLGLDSMAEVTVQRLASWLLWPLARKKPPERSRSAVWQFAISGDLPIWGVRIAKDAHLPLARAAIKAHAYLRAVGLWSDLVLLLDLPTSYRQPVRDALSALLYGGASRDLIGKNAGLHLVDAGAHAPEDIRALTSQAALMLRGGEGTLAAQLAARRRIIALPQEMGALVAGAKLSPGNLGLDNGLGGFRADGGYVVHGAPPAPWCNVLANESFGMVTTDRGPGFSWYRNSRMQRITAFASDPVRDQQQQGFWLRDESDGRYASVWEDALTTHGFGFSRYESNALGLRLKLDVFVDEQQPVQAMLLQVSNPEDKPRKLSATGFVHWLLGSALIDAAQVRCETRDGLALAQSPGLRGVRAFLCFAGREAESSGDGASFLWPHGLHAPRGMGKEHLENGQCDIPSGIVRTFFTLEAGQTETLCLLLGIGDAEQIAPAFAQGGAQLRLNRVRAAWLSRQEALLPRLPDAAASVLLGCWMPYQALSSRIWAHAGFYQAGGAIGFRDQLQDMLAFRFTDPARVRAHIIEAAAHQFPEGDVQHWWHPPALGVRTHITDDKLFLPYVTVAYLRATEDMGILTEEIPYLNSVEIPEGREDFYGEAEAGDTRETLHRHNLRAIQSVQYGEHGLPLMGAGDWNDGMNAVGIEGKGESVWLGFFLCVVLKEYAVFCAPGEAAELLMLRENLMQKIEEHAWDGDWYLRAWFDDGTPLGGRESPECSIDLLVQSWAVFAGARRAERAFQAAYERLVDRAHGTIRLLDPPFDGTLSPGYIRAYPPGIRENGGQYTHAAAWFIMAAAKLNKMDMAWELYQMILPTTHSRDHAAALSYRVEPYVIAADIGGGDHPGRGGWTWYTGSASLLFAVGMETLLGFEKCGARVRLRPSAPADWQGYSVQYRYGASLYILRAVRGEADAGWAELIDDGQTHELVYALKS